MPSYIPNTRAEQAEMLAELGLNNMDDLFSQLPDKVRLKRELNIPSGLNEIESIRKIESIAGKNKIYKTCFRGAGAYNHFIPSVVKQLSSREEFVTAYTPYQAEISQGVLQAIFEYQTMICSLTSLDASNASVYDGATALCEAVMMCVGENRRVVISNGVNPRYIEVLKTWCKYCSVEMIKIESDSYKTDINNLEKAVDMGADAVIVQNPNYYGTLEDMGKISELSHNNKAKFISVVNPISLALIKSPGEYKSDIAVGEGQPLGTPLSAGGPYLGFMASSKKLMRRLPGRIVGQTQDRNGKRGFVLTLQAREQHIRREKALSNICSNQALNALTAAVYLGAMGKTGLYEAACTCYNNAHKLKKSLGKIDKVSLIKQDFFHEFVCEIDCDEDVLNTAFKEQNILGPLPLGENKYLWCATEMNTDEDIKKAVDIVTEVCHG